MAFPGISSFKSNYGPLSKIEIMTTAESILIQDVDTQLEDFSDMLLVKNATGKKLMCITRESIIGVRFLNDTTSMV